MGRRVPAAMTRIAHSRSALVTQLRQLEQAEGQLLDRLDRVLTALSLTLDAEAAIEDRLSSANNHLAMRTRAASGHEAFAASCRLLLLQLRDPHDSSN